MALASLVAPRVIVLPAFPETAWRGPFKMYREQIEDVSICPLPYHYANLLAILSSQMGDFPILDEGVKTFLNFYIFSYGRTGTKKSTAMDLAHEHIVERLKTHYFRDLSSISSAEGLIRTLSVPPRNVFLHYDEVKHLFAVASRSGSAIEPVLNKAFGLGKLETVVRSEKDSIAGQNYFFNLVCNGTPIHISLDVGEALFHGGLLNRFLVFAAVPNGKSKDELGVPDSEAMDDLASKIDNHVTAWRTFAPTRACVRVRMSDEARAIYRPWYEATEKMIQSANELVADPIQRVSLYAKKLAATYALWETTQPVSIVDATGPQMQAAIDVAAYCQASILFMSSAWSGAKSLGARSEALAEQRVEVYLQEHGCTNERKLSRDMHMSIGETKKAVAALASVNGANIGVDRPPTIHVVGGCHCFDIEPRQMDPDA